MHRFIPLFLAALLLFNGCGKLNFDTESLDFDLTSQPVYYTDAVVNRGKPQIVVHPVTPPNRELTALMVPFRMLQASTDAKVISREISRQFWQVWLSQQVFPIIELAQNAEPYRPETARYLGAAKQAELAIGGYITHYYNGGKTGNSALSVTVEVWDLSTGNLLWSMAHSASMEPSTHSDYIILRTERRMPDDPMWVITQALARDMARAVRGWSNPYYDDTADDDDSSGEGREPSAFGSGASNSPHAF